MLKREVMEREKKEMTTKSDKNVEPVSSSKNSTRKRTRKWLFVILAFGILVGSFYGIRWLHYYITHASTDDANVEGDLISVSSTVSGKIRQLPIREGEQVKKGQLIAQLREEDYQAKVDVAAGAVQSIHASLNEAMADVLLVKEKTEKDVQRAEAVLYASQARYKEAEANMQLATLDFKRVGKLYRRKTVSASEMDKVQAAYTLAQARLATAQEEINENRSKLEVVQADIGQVTLKQRRVESLKGKLKEATAELEAARLKLDHTTVTSPIDGVVAKKISHIGEVITAGQPVAVIVDLNNIWVEANLEETQVEHVRLGQAVDLKVDAYPNTRFTGNVINIGAATASEFALIPGNRSAGNFTKVTQRIPIKIEVVDPAEQLRPGMMVTVGIDTWKTKK
ncbi:MAG: HlyD family secretion protein [Desulfobacteraceae bacterium]|nr:HlyD family secretion protein [Desulfobacteraceae bacterium]